MVYVRKENFESEISFGARNELSPNPNPRERKSRCFGKNRPRFERGN